MTRFRKDGHATSFLDPGHATSLPWLYSELVSYCSWSFRKLSKHSLVGHRRGFDLCWRKAHLCLSGGSLCAGPPGQSAAAPLEYEVIMDMTESIFPPSSHPEPSPDSLWYEMPWDPLGIHIHGLVHLVLQCAGRLASRLAAPCCVPCMLWHTLKRQLLSCILPSTVAIGGPVGITQKCRGVMGQTLTSGR